MDQGSFFILINNTLARGRNAESGRPPQCCKISGIHSEKWLYEHCPRVCMHVFVCHSIAGLLIYLSRYVENGSLLSTLKAFGAFPEKLVASFGIKILSGLEYLHANQVSRSCERDFVRCQ